MADLNEQQAAQTVKITGSDATGTETNWMNVDAQGGVLIGGEGTAGSPVGGVVSIQGVSGGTKIPMLLSDASGTSVTLGQKTMASSLPVVIASDQSNIPANITQFGGVNVSTGVGASGTGIPRVTVAQDSKILLWDGTNTSAVKAASTAALTTDPALVVTISPNGAQSTAALQTTGNSSLSSIDGKLADNYGVATTALRTAAQIGNTTGAADFNQGSIGAQTLRAAAILSNGTAAADYNAGTTASTTLRTTSNITRNGTELSYNAGTSDANSIRIAANLYNNGTALAYNIGAPDANTIRVAAMMANTTGQLDYNYGTAGAQTLRVASQIGNTTGAASFGAGVTGAQVIRAVLPTDQTGINSFLDKSGTGSISALNGAVTITPNGMSTLDLSAQGTFTATLQVQGQAGDNAWVTVLGYVPSTGNTSTVLTGASNLIFPIGGFSQVRLIAIAYTSGTANIQYNLSAGIQGLQVFNLTPASLTGTMNLRDGSSNAITSTAINSKQRLDVNTASEGTTGSATPFQTIQIGGSDGTNLRTFATDTSGNQKIIGSVASASTDSGNPIKTGSVFNSTLPTVTTGQRVDSQADSNGRHIVTNAPLDGSKPTYSASATSLATAATATDIFTISGSASKTIRITRIALTLTTTAGSGIGLNISLIKRSALDTGGTSTTATNAPHDSSSAAGTAIVKAFTANPTVLGTTIGTIRALRYAVAASNTIDLVEWNFGSGPSQAIVLRGIAENIAINFNSTTVTGAVANIDIEWTEE